jgi:hypothetical protein
MSDCDDELAFSFVSYPIFSHASRDILVLSDSCCFRIMERSFSRESIRQTVNNPKCNAVVVSCCYCCCDPFHWNQMKRYLPLIPIIIACHN